jgi:hypothetical protein
MNLTHQVCKRLEGLCELNEELVLMALRSPSFAADLGVSLEDGGESPGLLNNGQLGGGALGMGDDDDDDDEPDEEEDEEEEEGEEEDDYE